MFTADCLSINEKGNLTISGCDTIELAKKYGTPLYVMDENTIRENCRKYKNSIDKYYGGKGLALYASKAFSCLEIYRIIAEEGLGIDVVSGGELYTALKAGFPADRIYFHGNNKSQAELIMALDSGVARIIVDNLTELALLNKIAAEKNKIADIMFRIKPGIDAHTHSFILTGQIDSKFGLALENGEAIEAVRQAMSYENINLCGIHCHIGSQIFDIAPFKSAAKIMFDFIKNIHDETGYFVSELNLGGGFGIKYLSTDNPTSYESYMEGVSSELKALAEQYNIPMPYIFIEPGRSIVGPSGITLYTVGSVKEIENVRNYIAVDGGMADNPRYALYQSDYEVMIANKASEEKTYKATIAGRCCESGDLIQENTMIQETQPGDILAVLSTGAYNYSMSLHYNRLTNPAVVMVKDNKSRTIINRETYDDLIKNDI